MDDSKQCATPQTEAVEVDKRVSYVLGFLFRENCTSVVLMRKNKPEWQAGLLNGIGGKVDLGESPLVAMEREFREETGVIVSVNAWREFCEMSGDDFIVHCFTARDSDACEKAVTQESEVLEKHNPNDLNGQDCVSNLLWLVEMAMDENKGKPFYAIARYSKPFALTTTLASQAERIKELERVEGMLNERREELSARNHQSVLRAEDAEQQLAQTKAAMEKAKYDMRNAEMTLDEWGILLGCEPKSSAIDSAIRSLAAVNAGLRSQVEEARRALEDVIAHRTKDKDEDYVCWLGETSFLLCEKALAATQKEQP